MASQILTRVILPLDAVISKCSTHEKSIPPVEEVDGAFIHSDDDNNIDCDMRFTTPSDKHKIQIRMEFVHLDCEDTLEIILGKADKDKIVFDCEQHIQNDSQLLMSKTNKVMVRYKSGEHENAGTGFRIVLSAIAKSANCDGPETFACGNTNCISKDLTCDTIDHCADSSDEDPVLCGTLTTTAIPNQETPVESEQPKVDDTTASSDDDDDDDDDEDDDKPKEAKLVEAEQKLQEKKEEEKLKDEEVQQTRDDIEKLVSKLEESPGSTEESILMQRIEEKNQQVSKVEEKKEAASNDTKEQEKKVEELRKDTDSESTTTITSTPSTTSSSSDEDEEDDDDDENEKTSTEEITTEETTTDDSSDDDSDDSGSDDDNNDDNETIVLGGDKNAEDTQSDDEPGKKKLRDKKPSLLGDTQEYSAPGLNLQQGYNPESGGSGSGSGGGKKMKISQKQTVRSSGQKKKKKAQDDDGTEPTLSPNGGEDELFTKRGNEITTKKPKATTTKRSTTGKPTTEATTTAKVSTVKPTKKKKSKTTTAGTTTTTASDDDDDDDDDDEDDVRTTTEKPKKKKKTKATTTTQQPTTEKETTTSKKEKKKKEKEKEKEKGDSMDDEWDFDGEYEDDDDLTTSAPATTIPTTAISAVSSIAVATLAPDTKEESYQIMDANQTQVGSMTLPGFSKPSGTPKTDQNVINTSEEETRDKSLDDISLPGMLPGKKPYSMRELLIIAATQLDHYDEQVKAEYVNRAKVIRLLESYIQEQRSSLVRSEKLLMEYRKKQMPLEERHEYTTSIPYLDPDRVIPTGVCLQSDYHHNTTIAPDQATEKTGIRNFIVTHLSGKQYFEPRGLKRKICLMQH